LLFFPLPNLIRCDQVSAMALLTASARRRHWYGWMISLLQPSSHACLAVRACVRGLPAATGLLATPPPPQRPGCCPWRPAGSPVDERRWSTSAVTRSCWAARGSVRWCPVSRPSARLQAGSSQGGSAGHAGQGLPGTDAFCCEATQASRHQRLTEAPTFSLTRSSAEAL
jgi:hypothetical protein